MSTNSLTFRIIVILSVLTLLNMMFIGVTWHRKEAFACSVDSVLESTAKYLRANGRRKLVEELVEACRKPGPSSKTVETLDLAARSLVQVCESRRGFISNVSNPVVTLFTTWPTDTVPKKELVHNITLRNWLSLKPKVQLAVFTNDSKVENLGKALGFVTFRIEKHAGGGSPVLPAMFTKVISQINSSHLYGYVNSDILFTKGLTDTLEYILNVRKSKSPLLVIGRRTNVLNVTVTEASTYSGIDAIAKSRGVLFSANAEDFFITNKAFPWNTIVDVVVGRVAYDNWLVGHAICNLHIDVIDVSETVLAVHQTTDKGGNYEGFQHKYAHYNSGLFKRLGIKPKYESGFTLCAQQWTYVTLCGDISLGRREEFWEKCECPRNATAAAAPSPAKAA